MEWVTLDDVQDVLEAAGELDEAQIAWVLDQLRRVAKDLDLT